MRTLLLEDDQAVATFVDACLGDEGHTVTSAPETALETAARQGPFDLLVTDLNLSSRTDGADVAAQLLSRQPTLAVVMISGRPFDARKRMHGLSSGVILPKPFSGADLIQAIDLAVQQAG